MIRKIHGIKRLSLKRLYAGLLLSAISLVSSGAGAITAREVFDQGKRSYDLGRYQEASETLSNFLATWPDNKQHYEALYYYTLAAARTLPERALNHSEALIEEIDSAIATLSVQLPEKDLTEIKVAVDIARNPVSPTTWEKLTSLSPVALKHYLANKWHPEPHLSPIETLKWEQAWRSNNKGTQKPELEAAISLLKVRAMWQLLLSPLSLSANSDILKKWGYLPVHKHFENELNKGFRLATPDLKRDFALLGYNYEYLRNGSFADETLLLKNRWFTYLSERGINTQGAGCPR